MALRSISVFCEPMENARVLPPAECVEILFMRSLGKVVTRGCSQINIHLTTKQEDADKRQRFASILSYHMLFDFAAVPALDSPFAKKKYILDVLMTALLRLCAAEGWDTQPFRDAYYKCISAGLVTEWFFKDKLFRSPDRRYHFGMQNISDLGNYQLFQVLFDDKKKELVRRKCYEDSFRAFWLESAWWASDSSRFFYKFSGPKKEFSADIDRMLDGEPLILPEKVADLFRKP